MSHLKTIYITRHGQTPLNKQQMVHGNQFMRDCPLSEYGQQQANEFYEKYKDIPISKVYTSSLLRTQLSVQKFIEKYPHEISSDLDEFNFGKFDGQPLIQNQQNILTYYFNEWSKGNVDLKIEGGQSQKEMNEQQQRIFKKIVEEEGDVLVAMHFRAMTFLFTWMFNIPSEKMNFIRPGNLEMFVIQYDREKKVFIDACGIRERVNERSKEAEVLQYPK